MYLIIIDNECKQKISQEKSLSYEYELEFSIFVLCHTYVKEAQIAQEALGLLCKFSLEISTMHAKTDINFILYLDQNHMYSWSSFQKGRLSR